MSQLLKIALDAENSVSGIWDAPARPEACIVLAHGAGAGMTNPAMERVAAGLVARGIAVLRYNFPYMERGSKRVDPPAIAHKAVRAAVAVGRARSRFRATSWRPIRRVPTSPSPVRRWSSRRVR